MELKCDVLVVGAGPAGSMAAKVSAEGGADVVLIEQNKEVGFPVRCAEGVNKHIFQDTGIKKDRSFIRQKINKTRIYFYEEVCDLKTDHWRGYTLDRRIFDKYLAEQAQDRGAELFLGTRAIGMRKKGNRWAVEVAGKKSRTIEAKVVVGAGGFGCKVGCWAGITKPWGLDEFSKCLEYEMSNLSLCDEDAFHIAFGKEFPRGYGWIFPKSNGIANVGVGLDPRHDAKSALNFFLNDYPGISSLLGNKPSITKTIAGAVPINGPRPISESVSDGVVLVGDSAGIVEPLTGEGIASSILSGISAGEVISSCLEVDAWDKEHLMLYEKTWRNKKYLGSTLGDVMDEMVSFKKEIDSDKNHWMERLLDELHRL